MDLVHQIRYLTTTPCIKDFHVSRFKLKPCPKLQMNPNMCLLVKSRIVLLYKKFMYIFLCAAAKPPHRARPTMVGPRENFLSFLKG